MPSRWLAISALTWAASRRSILARIQVGCTRGWHRRHRLAAGQLQTKPLEGALDLLMLAPG